MNGTMPSRLFISHSHKDKKLADLLVNMLEASFAIDPSLITCTSLARHKPQKLTDTLDEALLGEMKKGDCGVLVILTPNSAQSPWVLVELGVAWATHMPLVAMLAGGMHVKDMPGPLEHKLAGELQSKEDLKALKETLKNELHWPPKDRNSGGGSDRSNKPANKSGSPALAVATGSGANISHLIRKLKSKLYRLQDDTNRQDAAVKKLAHYAAIYKWVLRILSIRVLLILLAVVMVSSVGFFIAQAYYVSKLYLLHSQGLASEMVYRNSNNEQPVFRNFDNVKIKVTAQVANGEKGLTSDEALGVKAFHECGGPRHP
jgi:hypothetical protein